MDSSCGYRETALGEPNPADCQSEVTLVALQARQMDWEQLQGAAFCS